MRRILIILCITLGLFVAINLLGDWLFKAGLRKYYCLKPADVLVIGHSMSEMGIDREALESGTGHSIAKYCMNGAGTVDRLVMLKHYIEATGHKPQVVLYDVSGRSFSAGLSANSYALFYPFMNDSSAVADYISQNASSRDYWLKRLIPLTRYDDTRLGAVWRGYRNDWKNRTLKRLDVEEFRGQIARGQFWKIGLDEDNMQCFDETLAYLNNQGIRCVLLALPCVDLLNSAEPEQYAQAMAFIQQEADKYPLVSFADLNLEFSKQYDLFADPIHLNPQGQKIVTTAIANLLNTK